MKKIVTITIACILPIFLYGCGTIKNLNIEDSYPYGGVKRAVTLGRPCNVDTACLVYYPLVVLASPFILADIILSTIGDTVTYPLSQSIHVARMNELREVSGLYVHNEKDCYISINLETNNKWYKNGQGALFQYNEKLLKNGVVPDCENKAEHENCIVTYGEWELKNGELIIDQGNHIFFSLIKTNEKVSEIVSKDGFFNCKSSIGLQKN